MDRREHAHQRYIRLEVSDDEAEAEKTMSSSSSEKDALLPEPSEGYCIPSLLSSSTTSSSTTGEEGVTEREGMSSRVKNDFEKMAKRADSGADEHLVMEVGDGERRVPPGREVVAISDGWKKEAGDSAAASPVRSDGDVDAFAAECRICQEEDDVKNLETPCSCSGSVKYAHHKCIQRWCNEKGDTICELCHQPYKNGYTAPPRPEPEPSNEWSITLEHRVNIQDPRVLALAAAERFALEDEYAVANATGAAWCRSAALILMSLLLLRHALVVVAAAGVDGASPTILTLFIFRVIGFLLPCYIMAQALSILHKRRQQQEAAAEAAAELSLLLQSEQGRSMRITIAPQSESSLPQRAET